jgi:hypothetical protein
MAKRMKLWVAGALLLAVGGTVMASNMGFKFVPNLNQANRVFTLSLPLNQNYTNADSVFQDINASCPGAASKIERIDPSPGGTIRVTWVGFGSAPQNFPIAKGEGYMLEVFSNCTTWAVVGSHDPAYVYNFPTAGEVYLTSIPYHTTATVAHDLFTSIPSCGKVERIVPSSGGTLRTTWVGFGSPAQNFPVKVGESYIVEVGTAGTSWTPAHY